MKIIEELMKRFEGREDVRKSPIDGLWYGIDRVLRCPCTVGHKAKEYAKKEWRTYMAHVVHESATQRERLTSE